MVQLNSLNDFNSVTIVCVCNCDICEILREAKNKTKQNKKIQKQKYISKIKKFLFQLSDMTKNQTTRNLYH